jgi:flagellar protein FlaI
LADKVAQGVRAVGSTAAKTTQRSTQVLRGRSRRPPRGASAISANGEAATTTAQEAPFEPQPTPAPETPTVPSSTKQASRLRTWFDWVLGHQHDEGGIVTPLPALDANFNEVKRQEFLHGTAYSRVVFDVQRSRHVYQVVEPPLDAAETRALTFIKEVLIRTFDAELEVIDRAASRVSAEYLQERVKKVAKDYRIRLSATSMLRLSYYLTRDFTGFGRIDVMMHDPDIEDISSDGWATPIFLYHRRHGSMESNVRFVNAAEVDAFVIRMAQRSGKQITIADPLLDSSLPDGSRLQATLGREVTDNGSTFTIRRFRENPFSPVDLVRMGTMNAELLAYCWIVVQFGANIMLAGGTASGKTTTLNTVSLFIPPQSKIVSIEDTREINLPHANWVRSVTRGGTRATDVKRVDMFDLLTAALRQRPEYILVGEVRGKEATVAFQAMATGHTVLGTIHADSPRSVVYRLESEPINIPRIVIQSLDVIIMQAMLTVQGRRRRRIQEVAELVGIDPASKELLTHTVFSRNPATDRLHFTGRSYKLERVAQRNNWNAAELEKEFRRRTKIIQTLVDLYPVTFEEIAFIFSTYENRPDAVEAELERLRQRPRPAVEATP